MICFPLDNEEYEADALGAWCGTRTRGVFAAADHFAVKANGNMTITVSPGLAWLKADTYWGVAAFERDAQVRTIDTADGTLTRIDAVCVRLDKNRNIGELVVKKGAYSPQPPTIAAPARNLDYDEIYVATIKVRAGTTSILDTDITDQRMEEAYCGVMRDGVTGIPTQSLYDAWWYWFNSHQVDAEQKADAFNAWSEAEFNNWFQNLKNQLDDNQAANLQNQVDTIKNDINKASLTAKIRRGYIGFDVGFRLSLETVTKRGDKITVYQASGSSTIAMSGIKCIEIYGTFLFTDITPEIAKKITIIFFSNTTQIHSIVMPINKIMPPIILDVSNVTSIGIFGGFEWEDIVAETDSFLTIREL